MENNKDSLSTPLSGVKIHDTKVAYMDIDGLDVKPDVKRLRDWQEISVKPRFVDLVDAASFTFTEACAFVSLTRLLLPWTTTE
jgi:hypothetical protein